MSEVWQTLYPMLLEMVLTTFVAVLGTVASWAVNSFRKKLDGEVWEGVIDRLQTVSRTVVYELESTIVPELKQSLADGKLTPAEIERLRDIAINRAAFYLGGGDVSTIHGRTKNARKVIGASIEATHSELKTWGDI